MRMAIPKHCGAWITLFFDQAANGTYRHASRRVEPADAAAAHPSQGGQLHAGAPRQPRPPHRAKCGIARMAGSGEDRGQEHQVGPGQSGAADIGRTVGRAGDQTTAPAQSRYRSRPASGTQVNAGPQCGGQTGVSRNHQGQPPAAADRCQRRTKSGPPGRPVMTQHHPGQAGWQPPNGGQRVGQPAGVAEQPQHRQPTTAPAHCRHGPSPGEQFHGTYYPVAQDLIADARS